MKTLAEKELRVKNEVLREENEKLINFLGAVLGRPLELEEVSDILNGDKSAVDGFRDTADWS